MMATIAELIDPELLKKLQELKAKLKKENAGKKEEVRNAQRLVA